ncbi:hypothetical protein HMPREF1546_00288 [Oscillibacter sp. KLE 1745]|nr:hypothetical protein HMPREF1546_00288 [Oscillibacter sp. KLE 1745]
MAGIGGDQVVRKMLLTWHPETVSHATYLRGLQIMMPKMSYRNIGHLTKAHKIKHAASAGMAFGGHSNGSIRP